MHEDASRRAFYFIDFSSWIAIVGKTKLNENQMKSYSQKALHAKWKFSSEFAAACH